MTTWTKYTEPDGGFLVDNLYDFLLQETGEYLLQQDNYKIELESSIDTDWTLYTEPSATWTVQTVN